MSDREFQGYVHVRQDSSQCMFTLRANLESTKIKAAVKSATGVAFPNRGLCEVSEGCTLAWMSPDELLITVPTAQAQKLLTGLEAALEGLHVLLEDVSDALFDEWKAELSEYSSASLRRDSERKLQQTRRQYERLITSMRKAEKTIDPVLASLKDNVLYLKHNLNARAIASLKGELGNVNQDVSRLLDAMQSAIKESDTFISQLRDE